MATTLRTDAPAPTAGVEGTVVVAKTVTREPAAERSQPAALRLLATRERRALLSILVLSAALNGWALPREGWGNAYYAAAVRSMLDGWHNLFFSAFDPGGFLAVDKPPLGFAIQALSAKLLGFSGVALILPQAIAGVVSVALLYHLVRRTHGAFAGLAAALVLALMPISVAAARNNTVDGLLAPFALGAVWAAQRAAESGRLRPLLLCAALVGLGFLIKFSEALLIVPACAAVYSAGAPLSWRARLGKLALAGAVLGAVCAAWIVAVDAVPRTTRPFIPGSSDGSELSVVVGANGLERLLPGATMRSRVAVAAGPSASTAGPSVEYPATAAAGRAGEAGPAGPLRLLDRQLAGQVTWLLPLALIGVAGTAVETLRRRRAWRTARRNPRIQAVLLWGLWLVVAAAFFSVAGFFHRYYLVMLAPAIAALVGIAAAGMWGAFRREGRALAACLLPATLLVATEVQAIIVLPSPAYARWLLPVLALLCALPAVVLLVLRLPSRAWRFSLPRRTLDIMAATAMAALLAGPAVWSLVPVLRGGAAELPFAGPDLLLTSRSALLPDGYPRDADPGLLRYLRDHHTGERYWLGAFSTITAAPVVLGLNEPVMALGGFVGGDTTIDAAALRASVARGEVRFFLLPKIAGIRPSAGQGIPQSTADAVNWVRTTCAPVADAAWRTRPDPPVNPLINPYYTLVSGGSLFDCADAGA